jgi:hypothetical protein
LRDIDGDAMRGEFVTTPYPGEEAALVFPALGTHDDGSGQRGRLEDHQTLQNRSSSIWPVRCRCLICFRRV